MLAASQIDVSVEENSMGVDASVDALDGGLKCGYPGEDCSDYPDASFGAAPGWDF